MKFFRFALSFSIMLALAIALDSKIGHIPPLGKFLSPFHGFWQNIENEAIDLQSKTVNNTLQNNVNIYFDKQLIPHVFAHNEKDLFFAQGYMTAYHRLWQMEFQLYSAAGRLSEILGAKINNTSIIEIDRMMRRIGLVHSAKKSENKFKKEDAEIFELIHAYTSGVNAYIDELSYKDFPIEYKLLDYKPEKWTTLKCFLLISNMHSILSIGERDLENTNALKKWGREIFDILYPERPDTIDTVIPAGTTFDFEPIVIKKPEVNFPLNFTYPIIGKPHPDNGSNSFVVNDQKTAKGTAILANEPDLSLTLPNIWYAMHLNAPTINVMGATLPGTPGVVIGFNDSIAWGSTNAKRDLVDWYHIQFKDEKRDEYYYNDNWISTRKVIEEIKIKNAPTYYDTVIHTHHGPVVYDRNFGSSKAETTNIAMKWIAHETSKEIKAIYLGNKAENYEEFVEAFSHFTGPAQNHSFASANNDIALRINGKFPIKWEEQGKFLMDGSNTEHEWKDYIPQEHSLHVLNPSQNFVSSANQHASDDSYPYYQYDYNYEYYRGRRINDRLRIMNDIEVEDVMNLQYDNFNYNAFETMKMMLDSLDSASFTDLEWGYYNQLIRWDYFNEPEQQVSAIYQTWWQKLNDKLWDEIDSSDVPVYRPNWYNTVYILKNKPNFFMIDNQSTDHIETTGDLFRQTFKETITSLEEYLKKEDNSLVWYKFKNTTVSHLLKIDAFSKKQVKIGGNKSIVNAASGRHGPSWRMIVELGNGKVNAWAIYPGSQTGNPGNPKYAHMIDDWASGNYYKLLFKKSLSASDDEIIYNITLKSKN